MVAVKIILFIYFVFILWFCYGQKGVCKHITYKNIQISCFYNKSIYLYFT